MNLGVAQAALGELNEAERSYSKALQLRSKYSDCHYNLGNLYLKTKKYDKALPEFSAAINQNQFHKKAWINLVKIKIEIKRFDLFIEYLICFRSCSLAILTKTI